MIIIAKLLTNFNSTYAQTNILLFYAALVGVEVIKCGTIFRLKNCGWVYMLKRTCFNVNY